MDMLNRVSELTPRDAADRVDQNPARNALRREIARASRARAPRRRLGLALGAGGGAAAVAAAVVTGIVIGGAGTVVSAVAPPGVARDVTAASAAELLNDAAIQIEENPVEIPDGSYLRATSDWEMLNTVKPGEQFWEGGFSRTRTGATGGAMVNLHWDLYVPSTGYGDRITSIVVKHPTQVFGDQQAVADQWKAGGSAGWSGDFATLLATPPAATVEGPPADADIRERQTKKQADLAALPTDPQAFLDETGETAASLLKKSQAPEFAIAPASYRATVLRAIALSPDLTIDSQDGDIVTLTLSAADSTMKAKLDTAKAQILQVDNYLKTYPAWDSLPTDENPEPPQHTIEVGSSDMFPADVPDERYSLTTEIVTEAPTPTE